MPRHGIVDTIKNDHMVMMITVITKKITETSGSFEETLVLTKGCKIILIKNVNIDCKISNGREGEYIDHSERVLLMKTADGNIIPIPKMRQNIDKLENQDAFV